jgi:antitoxin VapB
VRLFRNGVDQAVRISRELELEGDEAILRKEGDRLILEPAQRTSLLGVLSKLGPIDEDFHETEDLDLDSADI